MLILILNCNLPQHFFQNDVREGIMLSLMTGITISVKNELEEGVSIQLFLNRYQLPKLFLLIVGWICSEIMLDHFDVKDENWS